MPRNPLIPVVVALAVVGPVLFYVGQCVGEAGQQSLPAGPASQVEDRMRELSEGQGWLKDQIGKLHESVHGLRQAIDAQAQNRASAVPSQAQSAQPPSSPGGESSPVESDADAQRLGALPQKPTDTARIDACLANWSREEPMLAFLSVEDVVARFGRPSRVSATPAFLEWTFEGSSPAEGRPGAFVLRVMRCRVVQVVALPGPRPGAGQSPR